MKRKHRLLSIAVFLLVSLTLILSSIPASAETLNAALLTRADAIESALEEAFRQKSAELYALADDYRSGVKLPEDEEGNLLDVNETIAKLETAASYLPTLSLDSYALAIVEYAYDNMYVGTYQSISVLAKEMTDVLVSLFDLSKLTSETAVSDALIRAYMIAIGDKYASYFNESEYAEYMADSQAEYGGIGVTVTQLDDGYVEVLSVTPNSPAEKAGIQLGDIIVGVNGEDFAKLGYSTAINMIRGKEGEAVTVTVKRREETFDATMTREMLTEYTVSYKILSAGEGKIGFIRISQFDEGTFSQFVQAYEALGEAGAEKFVFDVRNNLGGRLEAVLGILEYILPEKDDLPLIRMQYKSESIAYKSVFDYLEENGNSADVKKAYSKAKNHQIDAPIAVLCNEFTASAGELFTSCLKDYGSAKIFGTVTYGKGMGQTGYMLTDYFANNGEGIGYYKLAVFNLSTFYYAPPVSDNYEGKGITPNYTVELSEEAASINFYKLSEEMDNQLKAATDYLSEKNGVPYEPPKESGKAVIWVLFGTLSAVTIVLAAFFVVMLSREAKKKEDLFQKVNTAVAPSDTEEEKQK